MKSLKILMVSGWGCSVPLAMHFQESGHAVRFYIKDKDSRDVGDGFIPKVDDYQESLSWADLVVTDDNDFGKINDAIRAKGIPVLGGTRMTDALEVDRGLGQKLFKSVGLDLLESNEFKSIEEAISYVQNHPGSYVVKVSGTAQNDKTSTYVGEMEDGSDVISVLEHMSAQMEKGTASVEVQEKVEGIEVGVGGIFNGKTFCGPCEVDFEHKKLMSWKTQQGIGPQTGEMGTVSFWMNQDIPLFQKIITPMVKPLSAMGFKGFFNINCIVSEGKIHPLEMTTRFGWPALPMEIETMKDNDLAQLFFDVASGKEANFEVSDPVSLCVVIGVPPLPYMNDDIFEKYSEGMPVLFKNGWTEGIYPAEAKLVDGQWQVAGISGCVAVCAAGGASIEECRNKAYDLADLVIVPNKFVRDDIGRTTEKAMADLEELGLIQVEAAV